MRKILSCNALKGQVILKTDRKRPFMQKMQRELEKVIKTQIEKRTRFKINYRGGVV